MSTHPYIPLYVDDYDAATAHLTIEEDGAYSRLIRLCWRTPGCSLPNDNTWIARKIRLSESDFERVARPVIEEFFTLSRGRLTQKRLKAEYDDISRKKAARKQAGKKGGDAKAQKTKDNSPGIATALPADVRAFPNPEPNPEPIRLFSDPPENMEPQQSDVAARRRASRIPADWRPSVDEVIYAITEGFDERTVDRIAEDFRDFWVAKSGQDACKLDWTATWRRWVREEAKRRRPRQAMGQPAKRVGFV